MRIRKKDLPKGETFNSLDDIFRAQMLFIAKGQYYKDKLEEVRNSTDMGNIGVTLGALLVVCYAWDKSYSLFGDLYTSNMVIYENGKPIQADVTVLNMAHAIQDFLEEAEKIDPQKRTALADFINASIDKQIEGLIFDRKVVDVPIEDLPSIDIGRLPSKKKKEAKEQIDTIKKKWVSAKQSDMTNAFAGFTGKLALPTDKTGKTRIAKRGNFEFQLSSSSIEDLTRGLTPSSHKLFDMARQYVTESKALTPRIEIPLSVYASYTGTREDTARDTVKQALPSLQALGVKFYKKIQDKVFQKPMGFVNVFSSGNIEKGKIALNFTPEFFTYLKQTVDAPFNTNAYKIENKYPNAYCFASKIMNHLKMNAGKPNENTLSVKSLLDSTENIPSIEKVREQLNRNYTERIVLPFIRDFDALKTYDVIDGWNFIDKNKKKIRTDTAKKMNIEDFVLLSVSFKVSDYPLIHTDVEILQEQDEEGDAEC